MSRRALQPRTGGVSGRRAARMALGGRLKSETEIVPAWRPVGAVGIPPITVYPNGSMSKGGHWGADFGPPSWHTFTFDVASLGDLTGANLLFAVSGGGLGGLYFPEQWRTLISAQTGNASNYAIATIDSFDGDVTDIAWSWSYPTPATLWEATWMLFAFRGAVGSWTSEITSQSASNAFICSDPGPGFRIQWHFGTGWYASSWAGAAPPGFNYPPGGAGGWATLGSNVGPIGTASGSPAWHDSEATRAFFIDRTMTTGTYYHSTIGAYGETSNTHCVSRFGGALGDNPIDIPEAPSSAVFTWGDFPVGYTWGDFPAGLTWGELDSIDDLETP